MLSENIHFNNNAMRTKSNTNYFIKDIKIKIVVNKSNYKIN